MNSLFCKLKRQCHTILKEETRSQTNKNNQTNTYQPVHTKESFQTIALNFVYEKPQTIFARHNGHWQMTANNSISLLWNDRVDRHNSRGPGTAAGSGRNHVICKMMTPHRVWWDFVLFQRLKAYLKHLLRQEYVQNTATCFAIPS